MRPAAPPTLRMLGRVGAGALCLAAAGRVLASPVVEDRVVETLSATRHTTSVRLDALDSSYHIAARDGALENDQLVLRNLDSRLKLIAKLHAAGRPDLASAGGMLGSVLDDAMSSEAKAIAIWQLLVDWRYTYISPEAGDEMRDPVKLINVYGYGLCGDGAAGIAALATAAGMPARVWGLAGHVVAEVWYDAGWHMFDADHEAFYRAGDGHVLGVEELAADASAILSTSHDPVGTPGSFMAALYTTTGDNFVYPPTPASTHRIEPVLEPLDEVRFDLGPGTVYSQSDEMRALYPAYGPPPSYANGTLTRQLDVSQPGSDWMIPVTWPFLLVGADVSLDLVRDDAEVEIAVACDGTGFTVVPTARSGQSLSASLGAFFAARRIGSYACNLRVRSLNGATLAESIATGEIEWLFQFAPRALQQLSPGGTTFRAELVPVDGPVPTDWQGFEIVHAWGETNDFVSVGAQHYVQAASVDSDLAEAAASIDTDSIVLTFLSAGRPLQRLQVFLDTDLNGATGYRQTALGAEYLVQNGGLYAYSGESGATENPWSWSYVGPVSSVDLRPDVRQLTVPTTSMGLVAGGRLDLRARSSGYPFVWLDDLPRGDARFLVTLPQVFTQAGTVDTDLIRAEVAFDASEMVVTLRAADSAFENLHIYLDTDSNAGSGYPHRSLGAEFLVENGFLYRYTGGAVPSWSFSVVAPVRRTEPDTNLLQVHLPLASLGLRSGTALTLRIEHWRHWETRLDSLPRAENWRIPVPNVIAQTGASVGDLIAGEATIQPGSIAFTLETMGGPLPLLHLFLNSDANPDTGYAYRSFGSDYLIQNGVLYRFTGQTGWDLTWTPVASVELSLLNPNLLEVVLPTAELELSGRRATVFVETWQDWMTPLDSLPRAPAGWELAW